MKLHKRYIKWGLIAVIVSCILTIYIYLTKAACWEIDKPEREQIISEIKSAPPLPDRFYHIYNQFYPESLERNRLYYLWKRETSHSECPCRLALHGYAHLYGIHLAQLTFWAEAKVTQRECLNYYADNIESSDLKGINDLAQYYQGKPLNELSDKEILELILVMEQPTYYNKKKHPERVEKAVENALKRIKL